MLVGIHVRMARFYLNAAWVSSAKPNELGGKRSAAGNCIAGYRTPRAGRGGTSIIGPLGPLISRTVAGFGFKAER